MRTPKFTVQDIEWMRANLDWSKRVAVLAFDMNCSYLTMLKIKNGTYKPNTREGAKSGLPSEQAELF